jgi:hypothetical protein
MGRLQRLPPSMKDFKDFPGSMPAGERLRHGAGEVFRAWLHGRQRPCSWRPAKDFKDFPCSWLHAEDFKDFRQRKSLKSSAWSWRPAKNFRCLKKIQSIFLKLARAMSIFLKQKSFRNKKESKQKKWFFLA